MSCQRQDSGLGGHMVQQPVDNRPVWLMVIAATSARQRYGRAM